MDNNNTDKKIDPCIFCVLVSRSTGQTRDCSTCELCKKEVKENGKH